MEEKKIQKRVLQGTVVSNRMQKTVVVRVERMMVHPKYGKRYERSAKFKVHDEKGECKVGEVVRFEETRPISKEKKWRLVGKVTV